MFECILCIPLFIGVKMLGNDHTPCGESITLHQHAPKFEALGLESGFFLFHRSEAWKDLLGEVRISVCECPLHTKLSLIRYDKHLVFFCILIRSYGESDRNRLGLFQAIRDGVLGVPSAPNSVHALYMPTQGFSFAWSRMVVALR